MRSVKKLLKKAMVFTLTAAMLVGTPLTASAAPLNSVFSISDGTGIWDDHDSGSGTGTVTNTDTTSGALTEDGEAKIIGIVLDKQTVNLEKDGKNADIKPLKATIVLDGTITASKDIKDSNGNVIAQKGEDITDLVRAEMSRKIKWEVLYLDENGNKDKTKDPAAKVGLELKLGANSDRSEVKLKAKQGTKKGEEITVRATIDSRYYYVKNEDGEQNVEVKLSQTDKPVFYTAEATVSVKEYSEKLELKGVEEDQLVKHTYNLGERLVRTPETANDTITWSSNNTKIATVSADGIVTFKKTTAENELVTITAVSEKGKPADADFTVGAGMPASKVEILVDTGEGWKAQKNGAKLNLDLGADDGESVNVQVKMYANVKSVKVNDAGEAILKKGKPQYVTKKNLADGAEYYKWNGEAAELDYVDITDDITWSSSKANIATVSGDNEGATITAAGKALGTAKITAKASSGKSANVNAVVKASLTDLSIGNAPEKLYSGQFVQLMAVRKPELNKDAVKWSIKKVHDDKKNKDINNPNASINNKGVLTIKPKLDKNYLEVTVVLETTKAKKPGTNEKFHVEKEIAIEQSSMDGFTITDDKGDVVAKFETTYKSNGSVNKSKQTVKETTKISVPKGRIYTATVTPIEGQEYSSDASTLVWKSKNEKIAKVEPNRDGTAKITAVAAGKTEISVSGIRAVNDADGKLKSAKAITVKFNVDVKQPTTSITIKTPSVVVKEAASKDAKVTFKTTQNKGAKETITWSVQKNGVSATSAEATVNLNGSSGKVVLKKGNYQAGDVFTVKATSQSGVTATATIQVVTASTAVRVVDENGATFEYDQKKSNGQKGKHVKNATTLGLGDHVTLVPQVNVGKSKPEAQQNWIAAGAKDDDKQAANVTYSVNKKNIVQIIGNTVYRVGNGSVKVTVKTADGKKYTLTIDDASKAYVE